MTNYDRTYFAKFAVDPDSQYTDFEDFIDFDFPNNNKIDRFADENIDELDDML